MKKGLTIFLILQVLFVIVTFAGLVLLLANQVDNAGLSIVGMVFSLMFGNLYRSSKEEQFEKDKKFYLSLFAGIIILSVIVVSVFAISVLI